jgi:predicted nucleic-acid-binding Zn-ribbon protein
MKDAKRCPNCEGSTLYASQEVSAGGGHAPNYLPGLGGFFSAAEFRLVTCKDCGLTRFFAEPSALAKLAESKKWIRL